MYKTNGFLGANHETFSIEFFQLDGNEAISEAIKGGRDPDVIFEEPNTLTFIVASLLELKDNPKRTKFLIHPNQGIAFQMSAKHVRTIIDSNGRQVWANWWDSEHKS